MSSVGSTRFMRPMDMRVTRRNHRRVQVQRLLLISANVTLAVVLSAGAYWLYSRTQNDTRFAIEKVETAGAIHTSPAAIERVISRYRGANLFKLNIEEVRSELLTLPWVERVAIEKRIPDGLAVHITERTPVALVNVGGRLRYVDSHGLSFAPLTVSEGNAELPIIPAAEPSELRRTVLFLQNVRRSNPDLFARLSEVEPIAPEGYRIVDREIVTSILVGEGEYAEKWRQLYSIVRQESFDPASVEYADLRFERRIIVKARASTPAVPAAAVLTTAVATVGVTN